MQARETRLVLRIESGERQGEEVALGEGTLQVGRRPECGLVLKDASVSGRHAELRVQGGRVELVDLGSTNGTRVGGEKVTQAVLAPGDLVLFGNVRASLQEQGSPGAVPPSASLLAPEPAMEPSGALDPVREDLVRRAGKGSKRPLVLVVLLLVVAAGAFAYFQFLRPGRPTAQRPVVPSVAGNLLADGSFEEGTGEWTSAESAPAAFLTERAHAHSGEAGLGVRLEAGTGSWSLARSPEFPLQARRALACAGSLRVEGGALGRVGVELSSSSDAAPPFMAWLPARRGGGDFAGFELAFDVPGGYDRGRLVVAATGQGVVALDDVSALAREPQGGAVEFAEYELAVLGSPGSCALFVRSGMPLLTGFDLSAWDRGEPEGWPDAALSVQGGPRGFTISFPGAPAEAWLRFVALRPGDAPAGQEGWVATTGAEGYASYGGDFTRAGVSSLLLGSGTELLRIGFERPVEVQGTQLAGAMSFRVALGGLSACELQLAFNEERAQAATLADAAVDAERRGDLGGALASWNELLDRFPYERRLVSQASETRARLIQAGLGRVDELRREMERARFFLLPELFRQGRDQALELASRYGGSEVEAEARKVGLQCEMALTELLSGDPTGEARRLEGVLETLDPAAAPGLVGHLRAALGSVDPRREGH